MAVDPKELREVAKAADAAADNIRSATAALSEQASVVTALSEAYRAFSSAEVTQQVIDLTASLRDLSPLADEIAKRTRSTSSGFKTLSKNVEGVDSTVTTLTGRLKDLSATLLGIGKDAQDGMFDPKKIKDLNEDQTKMQKTLESIHDTLKDMKDNVEGFGKGIVDSTRNIRDLGNTRGMLDDMSSGILDTNTALKETTTVSQQAGSSLRGLEAGFLGAAATGGTFTGALIGMAAESKVGQKALGWLGNMAAKPFSAGIGAAIGAVTGLTSGLFGIGRATKFVGGFFTNMISWAFKLSAAIIAIPVRFLGGLVEMAAGMNMGAAEYLRQIEEVRDKFGNFRVGQAQAIKEMQKSFSKTSETGLNAYRIYGFLHERLKMITELVEGLGATWGVFQDEFARDGFLQAKRIDEFRMGLGLSHEQLKSTLMMSKAMGKSAGNTLTDLTKHVKGYAKTLNISHKTLTRDIADALKDAGRFGGAAIQAIARASAYARALGHELKEIAGVLDAFETFDTAAEGAAKLAQSFGATVDAFKLVSAQSPDEMIQHLRDSFFAAGKSAENLTRQELKLLSQQTGLNEEVARSVFSMQNQGRSVEELKKKQEEQENAQVTQAKALRSLADDIKRLVKEMHPLKKSFVSMFIDGMKKGVMRSHEFLGLMFRIRRGLILTWREGFKLGRVLISQVPALKKLFEGLNAFFDPSKYKNLASRMREILLDFFKGNGGVSDLLHSAQEAFTNFFNVQNPAAKKMIEGAKMILQRVAKAVAEGITWVSEQLVVGMKYIAGLISGKNAGDLALAGSFGGQALGFLYDILKPVIDAVVKAAPLLLNALVELIVTAGKRLWTEVKKDPIRGILITTGKYLAAGLAIAIGTKMLMGMIAGAMTSLVVGGIQKMMTGPGSKAISSAASGLASKTSAAASRMPKGGGLGRRTGGIIGGWVTAARQARKVSIAGLAKLFLVIATIGAGLAAGVYILAKGLKVAIAELKPVLQTPGDVVTMMTLIGSLLIGSAIAANASKAVKPADMLKMSLVLVATGAALAVGGVMLAKGIRQMIKELAGTSITEMGKVMVGLAGFMALSVGVAAGAALVGKIGDPTSIAIGALVIGVLGLFMVGLLALVGGVVKTMKKWGVSAQAMLAATKAMQALATTMLIMIPVVLAATALGAAIVATSGVLAVAMAAGLQVIAAGVASLAAMAMSITKDLNNMKEAPGLERKAQVFTSVMGAINNMVSILAKIMKQMSPGLTDLVSVIRGGDVDSRIQATTRFITVLIPELKSIITQVMSVIRDLASGPDTMLKGAEIFASILQALGAFTQALVPPKELMEGKTIKYGILGSEISTVTSSASDFTQKISGSVKEFMGQIIGFIKEITALPISDDMLKQGIPAITNILKATAGLMSALVPDASTLEQFRETREASSRIGVMVDEHKNITKTLNVGALKNMLDSTKENFKELIKFLTDASFTKFLNDAAKVADNETKIKSLSAVGNIMGAIASVVQSLAEAGKKQSVGNIDASGEGANVIIKFPPTEGINKTLQELSKDQGGIAKMFNLVKKLSKGLSADPNMKKDLDILGQIFASIGDVSKFMGTVASLSKGNKATGVAKEALKKVVAPVKLLGSFIDELAKTEGGASISKIIDKVKSVSVGGEGAQAAIENMSKMTGVIKQADEMLGQVQRIAGRSFKKDIVEKGLVPALEAVGKMVDTVNQMNDSLSKIQLGKQRVTVGLRKLAGEMGVGGKANYTIRNKPVNIHLEISVEMKAAEVERAIIFRKSSVIRDQILAMRSSELEPDKKPWGKNNLNQGNIYTGTGAAYTGIGPDYQAD